MSFFSGGEFTPADAARLRRIEQKLDLIVAHLGINYDQAAREGILDEVRGLADEGRKIAAIKRHRELTGSSLVDAKRAVEDLMNRK
jgi:ribosomal protein L7/L12